MDRKLRIAIYMRLSKEDEEVKDESSSIRTQRILLHKFAEEHFEGCRIFEFQDDGYSGTNLNRPGVRSMLELVKKSALDCIIVKDFSRFSRDYIELGSYMEHIFPFMGVRFISVNDNYDSEKCSGRMGEIDQSFRNLMYDLYSKDLSIKVKSSFSAKKERGQFISANCPFGYEKVLGDKHMLVIEEDEAEIVKKIFQMTMEGRTSSQIAKVFNKEGIKTPIEFKLEKGKTSRIAKGGRFAWRSSTICAILRNEAYTGDMVYGKTYKDQVGGKNHIRPRSEWKVFRNHHAPIISREVFEKVQKGRGGGKNSNTGNRHVLSGRLVCACCGKNLHIRKGLNPYFCCPSLYVNPMEGCIRKVNAMFLEQFVMYELQQHLENLSDLDRAWEQRKKELGQHLEKLKRDRGATQTRLHALTMQKMEIYERYAEEKGGKQSTEINKEVHDSLSSINGTISELESQLMELDSSLETTDAVLAKKHSVEGVAAYFGLSELTQEVVNKFIRKIIVTDEQHIEICWIDG